MGNHHFILFYQILICIEVSALYTTSANIDTSIFRAIKYPVKKLNIELNAGEYYFRSEPFLFVKLDIIDDTLAIEDQLIRCSDALRAEQEIFYNSFYYNVVYNSQLFDNKN